VKTFEMHHDIFKDQAPIVFTEDTAPAWLCEGGIAGSTMDNRWFWNGHVLTLEVGQSVDTDFHRITRTQ
jgi:hypothetical protein